MKKRKCPQNDNQPTKSHVKDLIQPFSYEQLVDLLSDIAVEHPSVYNQIYEISRKNITQCKVFIRGLAWETTTSTLLAIFEKFGEIEEGAVIHDKVTGKSKGFGFVTYKDMESAQRALANPCKRIDGRDTSCTLAAMKNQRTTPSASFHGVEVKETKLFIRGLSPRTTEDTLRQIFSNYGTIVECSIAMDRQTKQSRGYGFITFEKPEQALRAIEQPTKTIDGRSATCNFASEGQSRRQATELVPTPYGMTNPHHLYSTQQHYYQAFNHSYQPYQAAPPYVQPQQLQYQYQHMYQPQQNPPLPDTQKHSH